MRARVKGRGRVPQASPARRRHYENVVALTGGANWEEKRRMLSAEVEAASMVVASVEGAAPLADAVERPVGRGG